MFEKSFSAEDVRRYYNDWNDRYEKSYGDIIQAFRPNNDEALIEDLMASLNLKTAHHYLDAGCGVAGVSIPFVQKTNCQISGITISDEQAKKAKLTIRSLGLESKLNVIQGDYHHLSDLYEVNSFDGVFFLESLGHSYAPEKVLSEAYKIVRPGGFVYIKDFYIRESSDKQMQKRIKKVIDNINRYYKYQVMSLNPLISHIRKMDVKLNFVKSFDFQDDIQIRSDFEIKNGIALFEGRAEFMPADWYEIKFTKF